MVKVQPLEIDEVIKTEKVAKKQKKGGLMGWLIAIIIAIIVVAAIVFGFSYLSKQEVSDTEIPQSQSAEEIVVDILNKIADHMILPEGEPTIATIENVITLQQQQAFFDLAQNGDQLVIYPSQAIIYRPSMDIIVKVGAVQTTQTEETPEAIPEVFLTFDVRNGTVIAGKAGALANQIRANELYEVVNIGDTRKKEYATTVVYDLTNSQKKEAVAAFAKSLGLEVTEGFPEGEAESKAEVLIILGQE